MSECIRRHVARDLDQIAPHVDPRSVFGLFDSGGSKIAKGKQAMISESIDFRIYHYGPQHRRAFAVRP